MADLIGIRPALIKRTIPRKSGLRQATLAALAIADWICSKANVLITSLHQAQVVSRSIVAHVVAVSKLKQCLMIPLASSALFGVS